MPATRSRTCCASGARSRGDACTRAAELRRTVLIGRRFARLRGVPSRPSRPPALPYRTACSGIAIQCSRVPRSQQRSPLAWWVRTPRELHRRRSPRFSGGLSRWQFSIARSRSYFAGCETSRSSGRQWGFVSTSPSAGCRADTRSQKEGPFTVFPDAVIAFFLAKPKDPGAGGSVVHIRSAADLVQLRCDLGRNDHIVLAGMGSSSCPGGGPARDLRSRIARPNRPPAGARPVGDGKTVLHL